MISEEATHNGRHRDQLFLRLELDDISDFRRKLNADVMLLLSHI